MGLEIFENVLDTVMRMADKLGELDETASRFFEALESEEYIEAAEAAAEAADTVARCIEDANERLVIDAFGAITGIDVESTDVIVEAMDSVRDFLADAREWIEDIPASRWLPIAANTIMAAAAFAGGDVLHGTLLAGKVLIDFHHLMEDYPFVGDEFDPMLPAEPTLQPEFVDVTPEEMMRMQEI